MDWEDRITLAPDVLVGKPVVKDTRLAVEFIVDLLARGWSEEDLLRNYPGLTKGDVRACLGYASAVLHGGIAHPLNETVTTSPDGIAAVVAELGRDRTHGD